MGPHAQRLANVPRSRIEPKIKLSGQRFTLRKPPNGDFAAYVSRSVAYAPYQYRARITMHAPVKKIAEHVPPTAGVLEAIDKKTCMLKAGSQSLDGLAAHLAWLGVDFEVHEPPELIEHIQRLIKRLQQAVVGKIQLA